MYWLDPGAGKPAADWLTWVSVAILPVQFLVSAVPWWLHGNWFIFCITVVGTTLALITASLPQWTMEKYDARKNDKRDSYILTRGNGHPHIFVFLERKHQRNDKAPVPVDANIAGATAKDDGDDRKMGLKFKDMAVVRPEKVRSTTTRIMMPVLAVCWTMLLITIGGLERDTWYLFAMGAMGMVQNLAVAGFRRTPSAHGIPLTEKAKGHLSNRKTMGLLREAEDWFPGIGLLLLREFFATTDLREDEKYFWDNRRASLKDRRRRFKDNRVETLDLKGETVKNLHELTRDGAMALSPPVVFNPVLNTSSRALAEGSQPEVGSNGGDMLFGSRA